MLYKVCGNYTFDFLFFLKKKKLTSLLFFSVKNVVTEVEPIKGPVHPDSEFAVHVSIKKVYYYEEKKF